MLLLFLFFGIFRGGLPGTIGRLNLYFIASLIILLPNACKNKESYDKKHIYEYYIYFIFRFNDATDITDLI